jgi:hypothetical protein
MTKRSAEKKAKNELEDILLIQNRSNDKAHRCKEFLDIRMIENIFDQLIQFILFISCSKESNRFTEQIDEKDL